MMKIFLAIIFFNSMPFLTDSPQVKGWQGIVPLHSTRADVERLLGLGSKQCKCSYYMDNVNVFIGYSPGNCKSGKGDWDVPPDTVLWITVVPKPMARLSDLKIDESKFKKKQTLQEKIIDYHNEEEGLTLEVHEGLVQAFVYGPSKADQHLRCR